LAIVLYVLRFTTFDYPFGSFKLFSSCTFTDFKIKKNISASNGTSNAASNGTSNVASNDTSNVASNGTSNVASNGTSNGNSNVASNGTSHVASNGTSNVASNGTSNVVNHSGRCSHTLNGTDSQPWLGAKAD
jgi:hypothetical protein